MTPELQLQALLDKAKQRWQAMTPAERDEMLRQQRESYLRGELAWPKPRYTCVNGVKVYESYEDYVNG